MSKLDEKILDAMHVLACARFGVKPEDGRTELSVDYNKEVIIFDKDNGYVHFEVNCRDDSESSAVHDFASKVLCA